MKTAVRTHTSRIVHPAVGQPARRWRRAIVAVAVLGAALAPSPARAADDAVLAWNDIMVRTLIQQGQNPFTQARFAAIVQLAVFEAVNATSGDHEPYIGIPPAPGGSAEAAAVTAAYRTLKAYFPGAADLDAAHAASLAAIPESTAKAAGIEAGEAAAAALVALRASDGASPPTVSPALPAAPGVWQVTTPGCAPTATGGVFYHWGGVAPFGVPDVRAFAPGPPPRLTSREFAKDYEEVRRMGHATSPDRPQDRTDVARFYHASSPTLILNLAARQLSAARQRSLVQNARDLALLNMAVTDALFASMGAKYHYTFWRPETAIHYPDAYGKGSTPPDPTFAPLIATPCFPSYPSNHASGSRAGAEILRRLYGEAGHAFTLSNPYNPAVAHLQFTYSKLGDLCDDVDDARIYGGIHFRFDQEAGNRLGRRVATWVYKHNLRRVR